MCHKSDKPKAICFFKVEGIYLCLLIWMYDSLFLKAATKSSIDLKEARSNFIHRIFSFLVFFFNSSAVVFPSSSLRHANITFAPETLETAHNIER